MTVLSLIILAGCSREKSAEELFVEEMNQGSYDFTCEIKEGSNVSKTISGEREGNNFFMYSKIELKNFGNEEFFLVQNESTISKIYRNATDFKWNKTEINDSTYEYIQFLNELNFKKLELNGTSFTDKNGNIKLKVDLNEKITLTKIVDSVTYTLTYINNNDIKVILPTIGTLNNDEDTEKLSKFCEITQTGSYSYSVDRKQSWNDMSFEYNNSEYWRNGATYAIRNGNQVKHYRAKYDIHLVATYREVVVDYSEDILLFNIDFNKFFYSYTLDSFVFYSGNETEPKAYILNKSSFSNSVKLTIIDYKGGYEEIKVSITGINNTTVKRPDNIIL